MIWTTLNATGFPSFAGHDPPGTGAARTDGPPQLLPGLVLPMRVACADGQVLQWTGDGWDCGVDDDTLYTPGIGLELTGTVFSIAAGGVGSLEIADSAVETVLNQGTMTGMNVFNKRGVNAV